MDADAPSRYDEGVSRSVYAIQTVWHFTIFGVVMGTPQMEANMMENARLSAKKAEFSYIMNFTDKSKTWDGKYIIYTIFRGRFYACFVAVSYKNGS